jgi:alkanesulfonate monooxygenase SsuD/methylene tetrahydromethanopterin reductase-like flavin-dependent oxidoreductase (luciferase family)
MSRLADVVGRLGFAFDAALGPQIASSVAPVVEQLGYNSVWTNDTSSPGLPVVAAMQRVTSRIPAGVGVIACTRRSPSDIATAVHDLGIDLGRAVIGSGSGDAEHPIDAVREAISELRRLLGPTARIALGALGPLMCRLAGEIADVVLLNWMTPERIRWARERVREGERRAGRREGSVVVASYVRVAVRLGARDRLEAAVAGYAKNPRYARSFAAMGVSPASVGVTADGPADARAALAPYREVLDETIVRALPASPDAGGVLEVARACAP